ncbi:MAG: hypothetical protein FWF59_05365, partial [Turicibacter sp.]|nr:hypothetical protein [Turicibacter sp.]
VLSFTDDELLPDTSHTYYVVAHLVSSFSSQETVTTLPSLTPNHYTHNFSGQGSTRMLNITNHGSTPLPSGWVLQFNVTGFAVTTHAPASSVTANHGQLLTATVNAPLLAYGTVSIPVRTSSGNPNISNIRVDGEASVAS